LKVANWNLTILAEGIKIDRRSIPWNKLLNCKINRGYFWSTIEFNDDRDSALKGVPNLGARRLQALSKSAKYVLEATRQIDEAIQSTHYFSEYDRHLLVHKLKELVNWTETDDVVASLKLIPTLINQHARIQNYIRGDCKEIETRNSSFVNGELTHRAEWIKEMRLTEEQARSVIIMEDRNLLVAAAGSGKTSTIVTKAAYAIEAGYCKPNEILILSFNKDVRDQIALRLKRQLPAASDPTAISVETFHSFGREQIKLLGKPVRLAAWAPDAKSEKAHICRLMESLSTKKHDFALDLALFCSVWSKSEESEKDEIKTGSGAESFEEAFRLLSDRKIPTGVVPRYDTLTGETVRSLQELKICNWLTLMGIAFEYEKPFPKSAGWNSYLPDFFYPQVGCWHEHFGINKFGKAPQYSASNRNPARKTYEAEVEEKRNFLDKSGVDWFETTSADFESEEWWKKIKQELKKRGLTPEFIGWEQFQELSKNPDASIREIAALIISCLHHAKSNRLSHEDIKALSDGQSARANAFLRVFLPVHDAYQESLRGDDLIDFEDMISLASDAFQSGQLRHKYRLILVDEFQDVSNSRAQLISSLLAQSPDVRFFAVGDDWQSIYRFAGADISAMTKFSERFGFTEKTWLTKTFRNNQSIADVASKFVMKNEAQFKKTIRSEVPRRAGSIEIAFHLGNQMPMLKDKLFQLAKQAKSRGKLGTVLFLGRYNHSIPKELKLIIQEFKEELQIDALTIHRAKGLEADVVFLLGATNRKGSDFPSSINDDPIVSLFMTPVDEILWAEERRLLYVALTRAKHQVFVVTPQGEASTFVSELLDDPDVRCSQFDGMKAVSVQNGKSLLRGMQCPKCKKGILVPRVGRFGPYVICNREGDCKYRHQVTPE
jgi:DNA helicase IV